MTKAKIDYEEGWLDRFKNTFTYEKETGFIVYKIYYRGSRIGTRADSIKSRGYRKGVHKGYSIVVNFEKVQILSTRAAFFLELGVIPSEDIEIDHEDGDTLNNKWSNLRMATSSENNCNSKVQSNNTSGVKGLSVTKFGTYRTTINIPGGDRLRETFKSKEEAIMYLEDIRNKHHKEFARHE